LLSTNTTAGGLSSITLIIPAGQSTSSSFNLIGLADTGTVTLGISGAPVTLTTSAVALQPAGFLFAQLPTTMTVNSSSTFLVESIMLNPLTLALDTAMPLRPGLGPLTINIASSNSAVIPAPAPVLYYSGDSNERVTITAKSAGSATVSIQQPPGFATPSGGASISITVR
jgi:hypothetical protein